MWFVFPQVEGLGTSDRTATDAVADQVVDEGVPIGDLFPDPDDLKLVSSLTLFTGIARARPLGSNTSVRWLARAHAVLDPSRSEGYEPGLVTERFLAR